MQTQKAHFYHLKCCFSIKLNLEDEQLVLTPSGQLVSVILFSQSH